MKNQYNCHYTKISVILVKQVGNVYKLFVL